MTNIKSFFQERENNVNSGCVRLLGGSENVDGIGLDKGEEGGLGGMGGRET